MLGDPVRRRVLEVLARGEHSAGALADVIGTEFGISQPAVSPHQRVVGAQGVAPGRGGGGRFVGGAGAGALGGGGLSGGAPAPLREADAWLDQFRGFWEQRLDALGTELARGQRERRQLANGTARSEGPGDGGQSVGA